jgi:hypothetical protein
MSLNRVLTEMVEGDDSLLGLIDQEDFSMFAVRFAGGTILEDLALLLAGSTAPISRAVKDRRRADLRRLTRAFFRHVLNLSWIPVDVSIRLVEDEGILSALGAGQVDVLANSAVLLALPELEGHEGRLPDLLRASRLSGLMDAVTADLLRAESLVAEVELLVK